MSPAEAVQLREFERILTARRLATRFQPILDAGEGRLFAHEALLRGPPETPLHDPLRLFAAALRAQRCLELDVLAMELAIERFAAAGVPGKLFVNMLPATVLGDDALAARIGTALAKARLDPQRLVIEITEHGQSLDAEAMRLQGARLRALGCEIAIDDFGTGTSGLKIWSELRPDYVKVDRYFIERIESDPVAVEMLRAMLDMAHVMGSRVIAEGIETESQLEILRRTGVDYLQGFYISRPLEQATDQSGRFGVLPMPVRPEAGASCVGDLCLTREPVSAETRVSEALALFHANPDWESLPVVSQGRPLGMLRRDALLLLLSKPLHPEIYNPKPVTKVMDAHALVIDFRTRLNQASRLVTRNRGSRINEEFIIARDGRYAGLGRSVELLHHITEQQLLEAQQSNPLTLLPGNREIDAEIFRLLALRTPFAVCHADIDHFKPFNDQYGYSAGDQVLLHLAGLCRSAVSVGVDFVGHPGGDDFILVMRSPDWSRRITRIVDSFSASCGRFYSDEHLKAGGFAGRDREGRTREFPLMTLSVGVAVVEPDRYANPAALMHALSGAKQQAKMREGNAMIVSDGESESTLRLRAQRA